MAILYVLAHFDDEYGALPLIRRFQRGGETQRFVYLTQPVRGASGAVRRRETEALLSHLGLAKDCLVHCGETPAIPDGRLGEHLAPAFGGLERIAGGLEPISHIVTPAWEGGHADHDCCAALGAALARRCGATALQFSFYNGRGVPAPLFRAADPLPANGPTQRLPMSAAEWRRYATAVRFYPSQLPVWSTLWPAMFMRFVAHGYQYQNLDVEHLRQRPHAGPLLYERRGHAAYASLARAVGDFLNGV